MLYRKVVEVESLKNCLTPGDWTVCSLKFVARKVFADRELPSPRTWFRLCVAFAHLRNTSYA